MFQQLKACLSFDHPKHAQVSGWGENDRGVSYTFGPDLVSEFLTKHDLDLVCRAHQARRLRWASPARSRSRKLTERDLQLVSRSHYANPKKLCEECLPRFGVKNLAA